MLTPGSEFPQGPPFLLALSKVLRATLVSPAAPDHCKSAQLCHPQARASPVTETPATSSIDQSLSPLRPPPVRLLRPVVSSRSSVLFCLIALSG